MQFSWGEHLLKTAIINMGTETRFEHDTKTMKVTIRVGVLEKSILNLLINVKNTFKRQYCMSFLP